LTLFSILPQLSFSAIINTALYTDYYYALQVELSHLKKAYGSLVDQMNTIFSQRLWYVMLEQFLMKYVWSGTGMIMVSLPILTSSRRNGETLFNIHTILNHELKNFKCMKEITWKAKILK
jgi:ABC transporter transmembrane region 2.